MKPYVRVARIGAIVLGALALLGVLGAAGVYFYFAPDLPSTESLREAKLQVPLRIYSRDGALIGEFGEEKRTPVHYADFPPLMVKAVLAAEDDRFFEHHGVDVLGLVRAAFYLARTGEKGQGGSTITMQVARNYFLSSEKTYGRKVREILLALKIERDLSKEDVLELYLNKIFLGNRAYGVAAAAQAYYGKTLAELTLPEIAMIAGLPKAPSQYNPVVNPVRATQRRNYVINRMEELGYIDAAAAEQARQQPVRASLHTQQTEVDAPYIAEMVRSDVVARFGEEVAYTAGYKVYTTIGAKEQQAANDAVRSALVDYERRHGYRGPEGHVELGSKGVEEWDAALDDFRQAGSLLPAVIVRLEEKAALAYYGQSELARIEWKGLEWARRNGGSRAVDVVKVGDIVRIERGRAGEWRMGQVPRVGGALVSLRPKDGAVIALVGGFDFTASKFNRVTQAQRQPGSSFKPFLYSSALDKGFTPASLINDAPVVFEDSELEGAWRPENYSGKFYGPTRLREALVGSRNLVSIRLLRSIGIGYALEYVTRFGFDGSQLPRDLSLALGSGVVTPWQLVRGYAVFANGGFLVNPYYVDRIEDAEGKVLWESKPSVACSACVPDLRPEMAADASEGDPAEPVANATAGVEVKPEVMAPPIVTVTHTPEGKTAKVAPRTVNARNVYLMTSMMQDVVRRGTATRANELGRRDLAGKTGTTNDQRDAWFCGFNGDVVTTTWMGYDNPKPLGGSETGAGAALPMWIDYMREALKTSPDRSMPQPSGLVTMRINPETGLGAAPNDAKAVFETFYSENVPTTSSGSGGDGGGQGAAVPEQLF